MRPRWRFFVQVAMGGMSNRWVVEAIKAQDWFEPRAPQVKTDVPIVHACEIFPEVALGQKNVRSYARASFRCAGAQSVSGTAGSTASIAHALSS